MDKRIAYVAMLDIVGFSKLTNELQVKKVYTLENIIRLTPTFQSTNPEELCIKTTGDGAILCFFKDMEAPLRISMEIQEALRRSHVGERDENKILVRMGINIGQVSVRTDLAGRVDIIGNAVNKAERLMSFGTTNHILASREFHDLVAVLNERFASMFHFVGELPDKHNISHVIYNVYGDGVGNPATPVPKKEEKKESAPTPIAAKPLAPPPPPIEIKNPFQAGGKLTNINLFVGRQDEIRRVFDAIEKRSIKSIAISGDHKMGLSSFSYYLSHKDVRQHFLKNLNEYIFGYVECPKQTNFTLEEFFLALYHNIDASYPALKLSQGNAPTYDGFRKVLGAIDRMQKCFVMLIDEIDNLAKNESFDMYFFDLLRFVDENYNIIEIVTTHQPLKNALKTKEYPEKPFSEIFTTMSIGHFQPIEVKELLSRSPKIGGPSFEAHIPLIISLAGYHPYLLQIACSLVFESLVANPGSPLNVESIKQKFMQHGRDIFQSYWDSLNTDERIIIADLVEGRRGRMNILVMKELAGRGLITDIEKSPRIFSDAFKEFVMKMSAQRFQSAMTDLRSGY
ncbi:MAG: adenylate/guanylate cyclase domain-containing protein [Ignavibacteriales bacterium]|nr:adenylate/guanylate cyclase domain-containing protein [Ignavibacteriales bacterium]